MFLNLPLISLVSKECDDGRTSICCIVFNSENLRLYEIKYKSNKFNIERPSGDLF